MKLKTISTFIFICILFILFGVIAWYIKAYKTPPDLKVENGMIRDEAGHPNAISDFKGQYVLLSYYQTWCGDCIQELEDIDSLQRKVGKDKLKVVMVSDESWKKINHFKEKYCNTLDYYQSVESLRSQNIRVFPTTYLLDKNGNVILSKIEAFDWSSNEVIQMIQ
jgi:peroxiredoxin